MTNFNKQIQSDGIYSKRNKIIFDLLRCKSTTFTLIIFCICFTSSVFAQNVWDGSSSNNWNTGSNWSLNHVPTAAEDVVIPDNMDVTVNTAAVCKSFTISSGNNNNAITIGANSLTVTNGVTIGIGSGNNDDKLITITTGSLSCASITMTSTGNANHNSGITLSTGTVTVGGNISMGDATDVFTFTGAGNLFIGGSGTMTGGAFTPATGTVTYNGTNQTMGVYTYYNLTINETLNSATVTNSSTAFTVSNDLTVTKGNLVLQATNANYTVGGNLTVSSGATLSHKVDWATGKQLTVAGNVAIDGTYSYAGVPRAHLQMTGAGKSVHTGASAFSIFTLNGATVSADGTLTVNDNFWAMFSTPGSFSTNGQTVNANGALLSAGGTLFVNGGTLNVSGGLNSGFGASPASNGTINFSSGIINADAVNVGDLVSGGNATGTFAQSGGTLNVSGSLSIKAACSYTCSNSPAINVAGNWVNNGTYTKAGETVTFNGTGAQTISGTVTTQTFNNITINNPSGSVSVAASTATLTLAGDLNINAGTFVAGTAATINIAGDWTNAGAFTSGSGTVNFNSGSTQAINGPSVTAFNNVGLTSGSIVSLNSIDANINGSLSFPGSGTAKIATGANTLILASGSAVNNAGSTRYVNGNLQKGIPNGSGISKTFEIGDASNYTPFTLTFSGGVGGNGSITAYTVNSDEPNITSSTIDETQDVNRYWSLTNNGVTGSLNYSIVLNFATGDLDAGAPTGSFIIARDNSGWTYPTIGTRTATSTAASGITSFGSFVIGVTGSGVPTMNTQPTNQSGCAQSSVSFIAKANSIPGSTAQWQVNSGSGYTNISLTSPYSASTSTTSGITTSTLTINPADFSLNNNLYRVIFTNSRGSVTSSGSTLTLLAAPTPTFITAPTPVCINSTGNVYSTQAGMTNYQWTISGGNITVGGTTNSSSATVTWNTAGAESISVNYKNANGCIAASSTVQNVTVGALPTPTFTTVTNPACQNAAGNVYSTQAGMTNYQWTITGGTATVGGTTNSSSALVTWATSGTKSISINYKDGNGCTAASATSQNVTVNPAPSVGVVASPASICSGASSTLTATNSAGTVVGTDANGSTGTASGANHDPQSVSLPIIMGNGLLTSLSNITVTMHLTHPDAGDITATLTDPCGNSTVIFTGLGGTNNFVSANNYVFNAGNTTTFPSTGGGNVSSGNYKATFAGIGLYPACSNVAGTWTLTLSTTNSGHDMAITFTSWTLSIANSNPYTTAFSGPITIGAESYGGTNNSTASVSVTPPVGSNVYTAVTTDGLGCTASSTTTVTVNAVPVGTVSTSSQNICSGSPITNISLGTSNSVTGTTFNWSRTSPSGTITGTTVPTSATNSTADIAGTFSSSNTTATTIPFTIIPFGPTGCQGANVPASVLVNPTTVGGSVSGGATVCYGINSRSLSLTGNIGSVVKWQSSTDGGVNWADIVNTTTSLTATNLVSTTQFRAVVQSGNCPTANSNAATVTIDPPPVPVIAINYCSTGGNVQLSASGYSSYLWSTSSTATSASILVDLAGNYSLTVTDGFGCTGLNATTIATELVVNGDFSAGNTGFTSDYTNRQTAYITGDPTSGLFPQNLYAVGTNANTYHPIFFGTGHPSGTGNFMIINGSTSATPTTVWSENITITPNTDYYFSAFCMSLNQVPPYAQLQFQVNGNQVGTIASLSQGAASTAGPFNWVRFYGTWNSGSSTTATISIIDLQTAAGGNDFALDDISASTLSTVTFTASPNSLSSTVCAGDAINLSANASGGLAPYSYKWNGPNSYTSAAQNPIISSATTAMTGTYTVTVGNAYGCSTTGTTAVTVGSYPLDKTVTAVASSVCSGTSTSIQVANSQTGVSYQLRNNADNSLIGSAVAGTGSAVTPISLSTGSLTANTTFNVLATNSTTFCNIQMTTTPAVTVSTTPVLVITNQAACSGTVNITASGVTAGSTGGGTLTYWTNSTATTALTSPPPGAITAPGGTYYIKSTVGSCFDIEPVTVTISATPKTNFSYTGTPYCSSASDPLPTYNSGGTAGLFSATPSGLVFISTSTGQIDLSASTPGTYTVKNTITPSGACSPVSSTSSVTITKLPVADFNYSSNSLCQNASGSNPLPTFINGGVAGTFSSSFGLTFVSTATGQINILSSTPGNYAVINTIAAANGCPVVHDSVYILINPYSFTGSVSSSVSTGTICNGQSVNLSAASTSYRSALLREGFNGTFNNWILINNSSGGTTANAAWTLKADSSVYNTVTFSSNDNSQFYMSNSNAQGAAGLTHTILQSPAMNTNGYTSLSLDFFQYFFYKGGETATVQVSVDGNIWNTVATYTSTQGAPLIFSDAIVTLDAYINQPTFYVRFKYDGANDNYWAIDNVSVTGYTINNSYAWTSTPGGFTSGIQNPSGVSPTTNTSYTVVATNNYGCTTSTTPVGVTVNPIPLDNAGADNAVCNGSAIAIGAGNTSGRTYSWSPSGTLSSSTVSNPSASPTVATTYTLTETITSTGCSATNSVAISVNPLPVDITVTPTAPIICSGTSTTIKVPNSVVGVNYLLRDNSNNATIGTAMAGNSNTLLLPTGAVSSNKTFNVLATVVSPSTGCNVQMGSTPSVSIATTGEWVGLTDNNWNNVNNWCSGVPTSTTDVVIPAGTPFSPAVSAAAACRNLTINSGSSFTINSGGDFSLYGNLSVSGTYSQPSGTLELVGSSSQSIPGIVVNNLIVNNTGGVTLGGNLTVNATLTLTTGVINAGADTVFISNPSFNSVVAGSGNTNYTLSWVNGVVVRQFSNGSTNSYDFPIGTATKGRLATVKSNGLNGISKLTAFVRNPLPGTGDNSQITAYETGLPGNPYYTPYSTINSGGVWVVEPNTQPSSGSYDISLYFNGFTNVFDNQFGLLKRPINSNTFADFKTYGGTINQNGGAGRTTAGGYALRMGLTSFSEYGIGQSSSVLPIELVSFTAEKCDDNKDALLKWNTAAEENNDHFDVEVATITNSDGSLSFSKIGEVKGNGTSVIGHDYSFTDMAMNKYGIRYYRLKQVDFDGTENYTKVVALTFDAGNSQATIVYPNPASYVLNYVMTSPDNQNLSIQITNIIGQQVYQEQVGISNGLNTLSFDVSHLNPGIYFLDVKDEHNVSVRKKFEKF